MEENLVTPKRSRINPSSSSMETQTSQSELLHGKLDGLLPSNTSLSKATLRENFTQPLGDQETKTRQEIKRTTKTT